MHMETQGVILQVGSYFQGPMTADHSLSLVQIDDPVDAVAVHFVGGLVGMLLAPIFMDDGQLQWWLLL